MTAAVTMVVGGVFVVFGLAALFLSIGYDAGKRDGVREACECQKSTDGHHYVIPDGKYPSFTPPGKPI